MNLSNKERYNIERQEQAENRKLMVLDIAQELFLDKGLRNTSMNDIIRQAKVSKATLYRYYKSIDEIAFEIEYKMLKKVLTREPDDTKGSYKEKALNNLLVLIDEYHNNIDAYRYIGMFDSLYSTGYPDEKLSNDYQNVINSINSHKYDISKIDKETYNKILTGSNVVLSFLQRLATRGKLLEKEQGITVEEQLAEFRKMIVNGLLI